MLNPFASDFQPFAPEIKSPSPTIPKKQEDQLKKKNDAKKRSAQQSTKPKMATVKAEPQIQSEASSNKNNKKKDSQANSSNKAQKSRNRRKSSHHDIAAPPITDQFSQETQFIAIEAAIDPVHRVDTYTSSTSIHGSNRRTSLATEQKFEHGYERYIDWIDRSLRMYDTVTVVGMDKAIVDVVSLVTILNDRKLGAHDDIETFTMNPGNGRMTSCIQVKLHPYF